MSNITPLHPRRASPRRPVLITIEGAIIRPAARVVDLARDARHYAEQTGQRARLHCSGWDWGRKPWQERNG